MEEKLGILEGILFVVGDEDQCIYCWRGANIENINNFIKDFNSEFIIISIKKESDDKNSSLSFKEALDKELDNYKDVISFDSSLPEYINDARGKIYIFDRYGLDYGVPLYYWQDDTSFEVNDFYIQDNYCLDNLEEKQNDIINTIKYCNENDKYILNYTSCYLDYGFPPTLASKSAKVINPWFYSLVENDTSNLGIVVMDYMSSDLAKIIYMRNYL